MFPQPIPTLFISKRKGFLSFAEEIDEILYGDLPEKIEFKTIDEAEEYQKTIDNSKYFSYIANVTKRGGQNA